MKICENSKSEGRNVPLLSVFCVRMTNALHKSLFDSDFGTQCAISNIDVHIRHLGICPLLSEISVVSHTIVFPVGNDHMIDELDIEEC